VSRPGRVIANGCDARLFKPAVKRPIVLAAGRMWDEAKGLRALADVAPSVSWPIHVAGPTGTPGGQDPRPDVSHVNLLGELPRALLAGWMACAAIYALPARYEPFGLSIVEAALAGCALVLGSLDTLRELWDDAALYVPAGDTEALAYALETLIDDAPLRLRLAERGHARAHAFSPERMASSYRDLYLEVLTRPSPLPEVFA
jgi:glycogen(starch) synthase